jgi:hypothetical protein
MEQINLDHLQLQQIEQAFKFLASRYQTLPKELEHLSNQDWNQLEALLVSLETEKQYSQVH